MHYDQQGNPINGATPEAVAHYEKAVRAFNIYRGDPIEYLDLAIASAPDFAMAHILKGLLFALATEPEATREAQQILRRSRDQRLNDRETSLVAALHTLVQGEWTQAAVKLDHHSMHWPLDLVALQCGHLMDFYRANARDMRDRVSRALPQWVPDVPGYSFVLGMQSFGLEESGDYSRAEDVGRQAVSLEPLDCWAHHAVAHVMEMQGRAQDGIGWMIAREPLWSGDDNFFKVHNWWHKALFHIDLEQTDAALALYDGSVRERRSETALDLVDASALLWRLALAGCDVGDRWTELAEAWNQHADGKHYAFNDWHAAMAYLGAGRYAEVDHLIQALQSAEGAETAVWARGYGLPLVEGFAAYWRGDHTLAVEKLHAGRYIANGFGGSHAQRDIIDCTLVEAALRGGLRTVSRSLAQERLALKPHSPVSKRLLKQTDQIETHDQAA